MSRKKQQSKSFGSDLSRTAQRQIGRRGGGPATETSNIDNKIKQRYLTYQITAEEPSLDFSLPQLQEEIEREANKYKAIQCQTLTKINDLTIENVEQGGTSIILIRIQTDQIQKTCKELILSKRIQKKSKYVKQYISSLNQALNQLHKNDLLHNQITLDSVYLRGKQVKLDLPLLSTFKTHQKHIKIVTAESVSSYPSPEQLRGATSSEQNDFWALGLVCLQMVSGRVLQGGLGRCKLMDMIRQQLLKIEDGEIRDSIEKMLALDSYSLSNLFQLKESLPIFPQQLIRYKIPDRVGNFLCFSIRNNLNEEIVALEIVSIIHKFKILLTNRDIPVELRNYLPPISGMFRLLIDNRLTFQVTDSGVLVVRILTSVLTSFKKEIENRPPEMSRIRRCLVDLVDGPRRYEGLLIGSKLVLTVRQVVDSSSKDQKNGNLIIQAKADDNLPHVKSLSQLFFFSNKKCEDKSLDYCVVVIQAQVNRLRYVSMVKDYSQSQTLRKLKGLKNYITFWYQADRNGTFFPGEVKFYNDGTFSLETEVQGILPGCPLIVVFSHNLCFSVGMFQSKQGGYLFHQQFYYDIWSWIDKHLRMIRSVAQNNNTRMLDWPSVSLKHPESAYEVKNLNSIYTQTSQRQEEFFLKPQQEFSSDDLVSVWNELRNILIEKVRQLGQGLPLYQSSLAKITNLCDILYGPNSELLSCQYFARGYSLYRCGATKGEIAQCFEMIAIMEETSTLPRNMLLYCMSLMQAVINYSPDQISQGSFFQNHLQLAKHALDKCEVHLAKMEPSMTTIQFYQGRAKYHSLQGDISMAEHYINEGFKAAKNITDMDGVFVQCARQTLNINKSTGNFRMAIEHLRQAFELGQSPPFSSDPSYKQVFVFEWLDLKSSILLKTRSRDVLAPLLSLGKHYLPQHIADLNSLTQILQSDNKVNSITRC